METKFSIEKQANFYLELMDMENDNLPLEWEVSFNPEQIKRWGQGESALAVAPPEVDAERIFTQFCLVAKACQKWQVGPQPVTDQFITTLEELDKPQRHQLISSLLQVDGNKAKWVKKLNVSSSQLEYIAGNTFKPLLKAYAKIVLGQVPISDWDKSYCPVCGDQPTIAKLTGEDGHRRLHCGRCETDWRFSRLGCPYCNNVADETYFITLDNKKEYRVYLCDSCKSYLKTVDERITGEVDLFCEDLATTELDNLVQAEGYRRGAGREQL
ncbi:formate dehydrogenase accessory protein FdhE [Peptococcaceae bacterium 1198_IL3148]